MVFFAINESNGALLTVFMLIFFKKNPSGWLLSVNELLLES
jgi:hypothetical protein